MPDYFIFFVIIFASISHAIFHSILKHSSNGLAILGITSIFEIILFTPLILLVPFPTPNIWALIIASTLLHGFYRLLVIYSYKFGDLSFIYPISRGSSSLLLIIISYLYLSDKISLFGSVGVLIICFGLFLISFSNKIKFNKTAFILSILTALIITSYTIVDGIGIRHSANPYTYLYWMLLLNGTPTLIWSLLFKNSGLRNINKNILIMGFSFSFFAPLSYGLVVWSMQYIPIAYVSTIRESSIIFATLIGFILLNEKDAKLRLIPAIFIVMGISILYFQL